MTFKVEIPDGEYCSNCFFRADHGTDCLLFYDLILELDDSNEPLKPDICSKEWISNHWREKVIIE